MTIPKKNHTKNKYKKKKQWWIVFFFIKFFLYLQYFLIKCTNSFYQILTLKFDFYFWFCSNDLFIIIYYIYFLFYEVFLYWFKKNLHITQWFHIKTQNLFSMSTCVRVGWSNVTMVGWIQINRCLLPKGARPLYID